MKLKKKQKQNKTKSYHEIHTASKAKAVPITVEKQPSTKPIQVWKISLQLTLIQLGGENGIKLAITPKSLVKHMEFFRYPKLS